MADIGSELRWILLIFSIVLIAGLYIAGRWGRRQSIDGEASRDPGRDAGRGYVRAKSQAVPQLDDVVSARERPIEPRVTIVADDEFYDDLPDVRIDSSHQVSPLQPSSLQASSGEQHWSTDEDDASAPFEHDDYGDKAMADESENSPSGFIDTSESPIQRDHVAANPSPVAAGSEADESRSKRASAKNVGSRKIIALRLVSGAQRFDGAQLKSAFEAAKLRHGKYGIYHRYDEQELTLFSVASMVEPGTFDPDTMSALQFQGIMLFAQLPGPMDGELMLDEMLACAEQLSNRLGGAVQDERGAVLTPQRAERMRDEIADFQHLLGIGSLPSSRGAGEGAAAS